MSLREFFPTYPQRLVSLPKSRIRFGTRSLYVDLPYQAYDFLIETAYNATGVDLTAREVRNDWLKFLQENSDPLSIRGKPIISASLVSKDPTRKPFLRLNIKWILFIEYLENKAAYLIPEVEKDGENVLKAYREIWSNFFMITIKMISPRPVNYSSERRKFRNLLKKTGDYSYVKRLLDKLEESVNQVEKAMKGKNEAVKLYTTSLIMDIEHLHTLINSINIPEAYLLLRNLLETFVKLFVYLSIGKSIGSKKLIQQNF